jgi:hypothetical protein
MYLAMTLPEQALLTALLRRSRSVVEFGSGGSTFAAAKNVSDWVVSVDSSEEWLGRVRDACLENNTKIVPELISVDIGPLAEWGYPSDLATVDRWPSYHSSVWCDPKTLAADLYFIDGRFRVACFMQALLNGPDDALYAVHDFDSRPHYHVMRDVAREVAIVDDLSIFVKGRGFRRDLAAKFLFDYRLDPA